MKKTNLIAAAVLALGFMAAPFVQAKQTATTAPKSSVHKDKASCQMKCMERDANQRCIRSMRDCRGSGKGGAAE